MLKVVDLKTGATVVPRIARDHVDDAWIDQVGVAGSEPIPGHFWLPVEAEFADEYAHLQTIVAYVRDHAEFIDADADGRPGTAERGRYLGFERADDDADYEITGTVTRGGAPVAGVRVIARDADMVADDFCGLAYSDAAGRYRVRFDTEDFSRLPGEDAPELYLEVAELNWASGEFGPAVRIDLSPGSGPAFTQDIALDA